MATKRKLSPPQLDLDTDGDPTVSDTEDQHEEDQPPTPTHRVVTATDTLSKWSKKWRVADDPYVLGVLDGLQNGSDLAMWASLEPLDLLPYPKMRAGARMERFARFITVLRNVAVFIPVALTWWAIHRATDAFGRFSSSHAGTEVNFLQFWQSGGDGDSYLQPFWRIQHIALLDSLIVAFIVLTTLLGSACHGRARAVNDRQQIVAQAERVAVGLNLSRALQSGKRADPESLTEALAAALSDLGQAARDVHAAAERMEQATVGVDALTPKVGELGAHVERLTDQFAHHLTGSVESLVDAVAALPERWAAT